MKPKRYMVTLHTYRGIALGAYMDEDCFVLVLPFIMIELQKFKPL